MTTVFFLTLCECDESSTKHHSTFAKMAAWQHKNSSLVSLVLITDQTNLLRIMEKGKKILGNPDYYNIRKKSLREKSQTDKTNEDERQNTWTTEISLISQMFLPDSMRLNEEQVETLAYTFFSDVSPDKVSLSTWSQTEITHTKMPKSAKSHHFKYFSSNNIILSTIFFFNCMSTTA